MWSCKSDPLNKNLTNAGLKFEDDSLIEIEISEPVGKYRINDSIATALILEVPEIRQIIDYKYDDSTSYNQLHIENLPDDSDNFWHFQIVQFNPATEHAAILLRLTVNANSGTLGIIDNQKDTTLAVDTWVRKRTRK